MSQVLLVFSFPLILDHLLKLPGESSFSRILMQVSI